MPPPLTLKQRLAALTISPSTSHGSRSDLLSTPKSPGPRIRAFFNPNASKRSPDLFSDTGRSEDRLQEVMNKLIFQAGVDYETRPMVVMNASALPDPRDVSYDQLLPRVLAYLDLYVESDYSVVFFAAGGKHTPGWNWVWKAYRSLSRKYRKNLKRLFIVHSNFFTKMLFSLAGAIISPKFFRKITYINTLSELAYHVPLTQIDIPPAVYQENLKHEKQISLPVPTHANIFGVPLEELMGFDGEKGGVPRVVKDAIQFLRESGLEEEGLFRRSPNQALLRQVEQAYDRGHVVSLDTFGDPHLAAVLLKKYLKHLPEPIFHERLYPIIRKCPLPSSDPSDISAVLYIREVILPELPRCSYILLNHLLDLLHEVSLRCAKNRMDAHNLSLVICPNLVKSTLARDLAICAIPGGPTLSPSATPHPAAPLADGKTTLGLVIKHCIERYYEVFDEVLDRTEAPLPPQQSTSESAPSSSEPSLRGPSFINRDSLRDSMHEDDEDIDDSMLVMPLGPNNQSGPKTNNRSARPPTAWNGSSTGTFRPRHRSVPSRDTTVTRSMHTAGANGNGVYQQPTSKARSMISIEKGGGGAGATSRRGSIAIGRGTTRKSSGSGVEAMGITASGFFTPPTNAPPVPVVPRK